MELIIYDKDFIKLGEIDDSVVTWNAKFYDIGNFQVKVDYNDYYDNLISQASYIMRLDDEYIGVIENIQIDDELENNSKCIQLQGKFMEMILERRVLLHQVNYYGTVEGLLRFLVYDNFIDPTDSKRKIPILELDVEQNITDIVDVQYPTGESIGSLIISICQTYDIGFKIILVDNRLVLKFYKGVDRSYNQKKNTYIVFSDEYNNLSSSQYIESKENEKNVCVVGGEGEGSEQIVVIVGDSSGIDRKETYTDYNNSSSDGSIITLETYQKQLEQIGQETLADTKKTKAFIGDIGQIEKYIYREDFFIGDIVSIEDTVINKYVNQQLLEIIENEDENGYSITPIFKE